MRYGFNLKFEEYLKDIESNEVYQYNLIKNKALISGDGNVVRYFYRQIAPKMATGRLSSLISQEINQSFLNHNSTDNAFVFYGITKMINRGVVRLITSGGVKVKGKYQSRINDLYAKNKFEKIWHEAVKQESGVGDTLIRVVADREIANHPIIEIIEAERFELIIKRGFIIGYIIKARQEVESEWYEMQEVYTKDNLIDKVVIEYVFRREDGTVHNIDDKSLLSEKIIDAFGLRKLRDETKSFPVQCVGLKNIPIVYKANTEVNKGLRGIADTDGMETIESALSEILSNMVDEIRKAGLKIMLDQKLQPINHATGEPIPFNHFDKTIVLTSSEGQDASKLIQSVQGEVYADKYIEASKYLISIACNKAGIHPLTVGITGVESIVASAESQQEREGKTSLRKRDEKLVEWLQTLKELNVRLLEMDDFMSLNSEIEYKESDFEIEFGKFTNPNPESIVDMTLKRINAGIDSIKEVIKRDRPDISDEELDKVYALVKSEKGLPLTPKELALLGIQQTQVQVGDEV